MAKNGFYHRSPYCVSESFPLELQSESPGLLGDFSALCQRIPPPYLVLLWPLNSVHCGFSSPLTEADQWPVHILLFRLLSWHFLLFYFWFPPPFVVFAPLWPPGATDSSIKQGESFVCSVRVCACGLDPSSVEALMLVFTRVSTLYLWNKNPAAS